MKSYAAWQGARVINIRGNGICVTLYPVSSYWRIKAVCVDEY